MDFIERSPALPLALALLLAGCAALTPTRATPEESSLPADPSASVVRVLALVDGEVVEPTLLPEAEGSPAGAHQGFLVEGDLLVADHEALRPFVDATGDVRLELEDGTPLTMVRAGSLVDGLVVLEASHGPPLALGPVPEVARGTWLRKLSAPWEQASWLDEASLLEPEVELGRRRASTTAVLSEWLGIWAAPGRPILDESSAVVGVELEASLERAWHVPRATLDALLAEARASEPRPIADYVAEVLQPIATPGDLVTADASGRLVLDCARAVCHGERLQLERKGWWHGLGYWTHAEDYVTWEVELAEPTTFDVRVLSSCPTSTAGTPVTLGIPLSSQLPGTGPHELAYDVPATDSFLDFRWTEPGRLTLPAGRSTVTLLPLGTPSLAVMDLDRFELTPVPPRD